MSVSPETPQAESMAGLEPRASSAIECDGAQDPVAENLYLIGRPTLQDFLRFMRRHAVNPPGKGVLIEEWQAANECVRILKKEEAGAAAQRVSVGEASGGRHRRRTRPRASGIYRCCR